MDLILGNTEGVLSTPDSGISLANILTRAGAQAEKRGRKSLVVPKVPKLDSSPDKLKLLQEKETSFSSLFQQAQSVPRKEVRIRFLSRSLKVFCTGYLKKKVLSLTSC